MDLRQEADKLFKEYFGDIKQDAYSNYQGRYWEEIFKEELKIVKNRNETQNFNLSQLNNPPMIITLGASPEPLVLAVHLVKPSQIYVIYNREDHLNAFKDGLIATKNTSDFTEAIKEIHLGKPHHEAADLFRLLRGKQPPADDNVYKSNLEGLLKIINDDTQRKEIILDITGAKKTISSGCFLFAAYADIPVYYMDFDNDINAYHPDLGRPYPGKCFYTRQKNPVTAFAIKEFQELENAFNERRFHDVFRGIERVIQTMNNGLKDGFFDQKEIDVLMKTGAVCDVYADWQDAAYGKNGDGKNLYERLNEISKSLIHHQYLESLAKYPSPETITNEIKNADYYEDVTSLCDYMTIELSRLKRKAPLPNQQLFLKIFCLEEFLIGFIWWNLIQKGEINNFKYTDCSDVDENTKKEFVNQSFGFLEVHLTTSKNQNYTPKKDHRLNIAGKPIQSNHQYECSEPKRNPKKIDKYVTFTRPPMQNIFNNKTLPNLLWEFRNLRQKRNDVAHFNIYVSDKEVDCLLEILERLWKYLLKNKPDWFKVNDESVAKEYLKLINDNNWYAKPEIAPLKWKEVKEIIEKDMKDEESKKSKKYEDYK